MVPRNQTLDEDALHARFIFNLHTRISFIFTQCTVNRYLHNIQTFVNQTSCQFLAYGGEFPSTLVPCLVATAPPFDSRPFHPFLTPLAHITLLTMTTSTILVFFIQDNYPLYTHKINACWCAITILFLQQSKKLKKGIKIFISKEGKKLAFVDAVELDLEL